MKSKKLLLLFVILALFIIGVLTFLNMRPRYQDLTVREFTKLPEMAALIAEFNHGPSPINSVVFSPTDPSLIACAGRDGIIKLWNRNNTNGPVVTLKHLVNHDYIHLDCSIDFSPDGELLASIGNGADLILWDVVSGKKVNTIKGNFGSFSFSPDRNQLATAYKKVKLWDIRNPRAITEVVTLPFNEANRIKSRAQAVDISPDGKLIATGYANGTINVWDIQTKQLVKTLKTSFSEMEFLKFSPDNKFLVSGGDNFLTRLDGYVMWKLPGWQRHGEVQRADVDNLAFSPDAKMFALVNRNYGGDIAIYSTTTGAPITSLSAAAWNVTFSFELLSSTTARDVSFSPDGKMLAIGSEEGVLRLWKFTPQQLAHATTPADTVRIIYLLPEGRKVPPNITEKLDKSIRKVQQFYADEMERHGFGRKTFTFETDENGKAKIYLLEEQKKLQIPSFDMSNDIWLAVGEEDVGFPRGVVHGQNKVFEYPTKYGKNNGGMIRGANHGRLVLISTTDGRLDWKVTAYELKYAFATITYDYVFNTFKYGFRHASLYDDEPSALKRFLMRANGRKPWGKKWVQLSKCEAESLDKSRFFNPNQPFFDRSPEIEIHGADPDPKNSRSFQFEVADEDGIHQVQLFVVRERKRSRITFPAVFHDGCRLLNGEKAATVEFDITDATVKDVRLQMMDMLGNVALRRFLIKDETPESPEKP